MCAFVCVCLCLLKKNRSPASLRHIRSATDTLPQSARSPYIQSNLYKHIYYIYTLNHVRPNRYSCAMRELCKVNALEFKPPHYVRFHLTTRKSFAHSRYIYYIVKTTCLWAANFAHRVISPNAGYIVYICKPQIKSTGNRSWHAFSYYNIWQFDSTHYNDEKL